MGRLCSLGRLCSPSWLNFVEEINMKRQRTSRGLFHHRKYISPLRTGKERVKNSTRVKYRCWALLERHCATNHNVWRQLWPRAIVFENPSAFCYDLHLCHRYSEKSYLSSVRVSLQAQWKWAAQISATSPVWAARIGEKGQNRPMSEISWEANFQK